MAKRTFDKALIHIRTERGLNQSDMAHSIKVSPRYYQKLESGKSEPSLATLRKALENLQMSYYEFFQETEPPPRPAPHVMKQLIELPGHQIPLQAIATVVAEFARLEPEIRASVLAVLFDEEAIAAPYLASAKASKKPKTR